MPDATTARHRTPSFWFVMALLLAGSAFSLVLFGQGAPGGGQRGGAPPAAAPQGARTAAPVDLTGYWVSIVTEDWIERMSPDSPPSGTGGARGLAGLRGQPVTPADPSER